MDKVISLGALKQKPIISLKTLQPSQSCKLFDSKFIETKYGKSLLAEISEGVVFPPKRLNMLTVKEIYTMLHSNVAIVFERLQKVGKYENVPIIEFVKL